MKKRENGKNYRGLHSTIIEAPSADVFSRNRLWTQRLIIIPLLAALGFMAACAPPAVKPPTPVADVSNCRLCHEKNKNYPLAADVYEYWKSSGHGRFVNRSQFNPDCLSCHDLSGLSGNHPDGQKNKMTANTYHLVPGFINGRPAAEWDFQVTFDNYCWQTCHQPAGIPDMRHELDAKPAKGAVKMGDHTTFEKAEKYPMDNDLAVIPGGFSGPPHFVTCVTCHDPHGSGATSKTGASNKMARENYRQPSIMCSRCHR